MKNRMWLLVLGLLTGGLSGAIFSIGEHSSFLRAYSPGIIFGVAIAIYLIIVSRKNFFRSLAFIPISFSAFYIAMQIAMSRGDVSAFFLAGAVGASILWISIGVYYNISIEKTWLLALAGGVAGLIFISDASGSNFLFGFILWQALVAFLLGNEMDREKFIAIHPEKDIHAVNTKYFRVSVASILISGILVATPYVQEFLVQNKLDQKADIKKEAMATMNPALCLKLYQSDKPVESWTSGDWGRDIPVEECITRIAIAKKDSQICDLGYDKKYWVPLCKEYAIDPRTAPDYLRQN